MGKKLTVTPDDIARIEAMQARDGIEAGTLGPMDFWGAGRGIKGAVGWGKDLYKTLGTVGKDMAKHPTKKSTESFYRLGGKTKRCFCVT